MPAGIWISLENRESLIGRAFGEHVFFDVNRQMRIAGDGDRDGVAGARIDFDQFALAADAEAGEIDVVLEFANHHAVQFAAQGFDGGDNQFVRTRAGPMCLCARAPPGPSRPS